MKKFFIKSFITGLTLGVFLTASTMAVANSNLKLIVDGKDITDKAQPIIVDGRTLVPAKALAEQFDANVSWDQASNSVIVTSNDSTINEEIASQTSQNTLVEKEVNTISTETTTNNTTDNIEILNDYIPNNDNLPALRVNDDIYLPLTPGLNKYNLFINYSATNKSIEFPQSSMSIHLSDTVGQGDAFVYKKNGKIYIKENTFIKISNNKNHE